MIYVGNLRYILSIKAQNFLVSLKYIFDASSVSQSPHVGPLSC